MLLEGGKYKQFNLSRSYWLPSGRAIYDNPTTKFYTPESFIDPWGEATQIEYWDTSYLLPKKTTDALGNIAEVLGYDWNSLQLTRIKDANDNISEIRYDALGMPAAMALKGKDDGTEGDSLADLDIDSAADKLLQEDFWGDSESAAADLLQGVTWRCIYDLNASPTAVAMIARTEHLHPTVLTAVEPLIRISYSDGFGRILMHKAQCEPTLENSNKEWIGSGRTIYNNKGKEVMQYEPYFSTTHYCDTAEQADNQGVSPKVFYDPLGRVNKTELPDGSFSKTEWTTWQQKIWDNNDTVLESEWYTDRIGGAMGLEEKDAAIKAAAHADTPTIMHTDTLARAFYTIQEDGINDLIQSYEVLDIQGNRLSVVDGRGKVPLQYFYNMLQAPCYQESMDKGTASNPNNNIERILLDVAGQPLYNWDVDDRMFAISYDELRRPLNKKVTESSVTKTLEVYVYGERQTDDKVKNLRGQVCKSYDGAGLLEISAYDFKDNALSQIRTYAEDATQHPNWNIISSVGMETVSYATATTYDALNRPVTLTTPDSGITKYSYDKSGLLYGVEVENVRSLTTEIVNAITYDAKGQRQKIEYENGTLTTYAYDPKTFRVINIKTLRGATLLQDLKYWYDPVGNITLQKDDALQTVYFNNGIAQPENDYTYDALYRLIKAKGREHVAQTSSEAPDWKDSGNMQLPHTADETKMHTYIQYYTYDEVGNIQQMKHTAGTAPFQNYWTRNFEISGTNNRLNKTKLGAVDETEYDYDTRGNMVSGFVHLQSMEYNAENRLEQVVIDGNRTAYYQYDSNGQRIRKTIIDTNTNITEARKYVGEWEVYSKTVGSSLDIERETLHISDDTGRIALIDTKTNGSVEQLLRYQYSNHLGSATLELDDVGAIISYEEYYPYGSTSFQSGRSTAEVSLKRYRYTGKERDEESGLYYHGARYYIPWLARWTAVDPMAHVAIEWSSYRAFYCNPIKYADPSGFLESTEVVENKDGSYTVVGAKNDTDNNIYIVNNTKDKKRTGETIGTTMQPFDFMSTDDEKGGFTKHVNVTFSLDKLTVSGTVKPNDYTTSTIIGADAQRLLDWGQELFRNEVIRQAPATFYGELEILREMSQNYLPNKAEAGKGSLDFKSSLGLDKYTAISAGNTSDNKPIITTLRSVGNITFGANVKSTKPYLLGSSTWYYSKVMTKVGEYNQIQNTGKGYNQGFPYFGEHTYSGSYIHYGFFGQFYKK